VTDATDNVLEPVTPTEAAAARPRARRPARKRPRRKPDPARAWARRLARSRPGLVDFVLDRVTETYAIGPWDRVHDPTSELVLTILSQNTSDVNAEHAFEALRRRYPSAHGEREESMTVALQNRPGWGGAGLEQAAAPDWMAVEQAPLEELIDVIRSGGLAPQKAPRIQASLRRVREQRGDHSLEFLGEMDPLAAREWLTSIDGIGKKTASVVLLFAFGMGLMPVDRHVERVSKRIGLLAPKVTAEDAHEHYLAMLDAAQAYPMHVGLITHGRRICHARLPACDVCPVAPRCRFVDKRAP
jgi:endonuclease III